MIYDKFPRAVDLGDVTAIDLHSIQAIVTMWSRDCDVVLVESGSPCQDLTRLSMRRLGLGGLRSGLFLYVPTFIQKVHDACAQCSNRFAFFEENVVMEEEWKRVISEMLGVKPFRIDTVTLSLAARDRLFWSSISMALEEDEHLVEHETEVKVHLAGVPPELNTILPSGQSRRVAAGTKMSTLTTGKALSRPPWCPTRRVSMYSSETQARWADDSYRYPIFAYEENNLIFDEDGKWRTLNSTEREFLQSLPIGWTSAARDEEARCSLLGNSYQAHMVRRVVRNLRIAEVARRGFRWCSGALQERFLSPVVGSSPTRPRSWPGATSSWPELALRGTASYNQAILELFPQELRSDIEQYMPEEGDIEQVVAPFRTWINRWTSSRGMFESTVGPDLVAIESRSDRAAATGDQRGATSSKHAWGSQVPLKKGKDWHIDNLASLPHPFSVDPPLEWDVKFAVEYTVEMVDNGKLKDFRESAIVATRKVAELLRPASRAARRHQSKRVQLVAGAMNIPMMAFMVTFCAWPDADIVRKYIEGFELMGEIQSTGVFRPVDRPQQMELDELLRTAGSWHDSVFSRPEPDHAEDIKETVLKDVRAGAARSPKERTYYDSKFGRDNWRGVVCFGVWQGDKFRRIDDGKHSLHNLGQGIFEKIHHCPLEFIVVGGRALLIRISRTETSKTKIEAGVDDLQDAYRGCPNSDRSARWSVVIFYDKAAKKWMCVELFGHSYGFRSSVNNFNEWPELAVAFARRFGAVVTSHYVDDFPTVDFAAGEGTAQLTLATIMEVVGTPFAEKKRQVMGGSPTFLGQVNDLRGVPTRHEIVVRPKPERKDKVVGIVEAIRASGKCTPENAAKLRGLTQFYGNAMHGKIARGCNQALVERQYSGSDDWSLNQAVRDSLDYIEVMVEAAPPRTVPVWGNRPTAAVWSDAEYEMEAPENGGGIGFLVQFPDGSVSGGAVRLTEAEVGQLLPRKQQVNQLEALAPLVTIQNEHRLRGMDVWWGIDNEAAEAALVKGYSSRADTAAIVAATHIVAAQRDLRIFYFHVDSDSNPSDGLSRGGVTDPWTARMARDRGWKLYTANAPDLVQLSQLPLRSLVASFQKE